MFVNKFKWCVSLWLDIFLGSGGFLLILWMVSQQILLLVSHISGFPNVSGFSSLSSPISGFPAFQISLPLYIPMNFKHHTGTILTYGNMTTTYQSQVPLCDTRYPGTRRIGSWRAASYQDMSSKFHSQSPDFDLLQSRADFSVRSASSQELIIVHRRRYLETGTWYFLFRSRCMWWLICLFHI